MSDMFNALGRQNQPNQEQSLQQLKDNPTEYLKKMGYSMPAGVNVHNPQSIINGLVQSGQIGNGKIQQIMKMMSNMRRF